MNRKIIFLAICVSCINADHHIKTLSPSLPSSAATVANVFHESGLHFVHPTARKLNGLSLDLAPPLPITHTFGFVSIHRNEPEVLVRTHSSQPLTHVFHSPASAVRPPTDEIHAEFNGQIEKHRSADDNHTPHRISHDLHINIQSLPTTDVVEARFIENENHAVHEINSPTQHFEYKVPLPRTLPQQFHQRNAIVQHSTYGLPSQSPLSHEGPFHTPAQDEINEPTFIPSQDEIERLPVFHNDKFLSPVFRHTKTPTITHSNIEPSPARTVQNNHPSFHVNSPQTRTIVNTFNPSIQSTNIIDGNNRYTNRFSLSDGTKVSEEGKLISPRVGRENVIVKQGEYEYVSPEGVPVKVKWIADLEGFRVLN